MNDQQPTDAEDRCLRPPGRPCKSCPWPRTARASDIPGFDLRRAEALRRTVNGDPGDPMFACHLSRPGSEFPCAGWLAVHGRENIAVRLGIVTGAIPEAALDPGDDWPELYENFDSMLEKLHSTLDDM